MVGNLEVLKFETIDRIKLCTDDKVIMLMYDLATNMITDSNRRDRTPEEKEERAKFYGIDSFLSSDMVN